MGGEELYGFKRMAIAGDFVGIEESDVRIEDRCD